MRFLITADPGGQGGPVTGIGPRLGKNKNATVRRVNTRKNGRLLRKGLRALDRMDGIEVNIYPAARGGDSRVPANWKDAVEIVIDLKLHPRAKRIDVRAPKGRALRVTAMKWARGYVVQ